MMKKIFCIFMAIALCLCMCACSRPGPSYDNGKPFVSFDSLFERVASYDDCQVFRHKDTNVLYVYSGSGFTVMFNADGTPMVWSGR